MQQLPKSQKLALGALAGATLLLWAFGGSRGRRKKAERR
jgi:hypothetical protein